MRRFATLALAVAVPQLAYAGGFELIHQSPAATGMAAAQTARADDPAAVYYNPAGMAFQRGLGVLAGADLYIVNIDGAAPAAQATNLGGAAKASSNEIVATPTLFLTQRLGSHFAAGVGVYTNFGEDLRYPTTSALRFGGSIIDIQTVTVNPSVAIRPNPRFSIGFGIDILQAGIQLQRGLAFGAGEGNVNMGFSGTGVGGNVGLMVVAIPKYLNIGFTYRSSINVDADGHAAFNGPAELGVTGRQTATTSVELPHNFALGLGSDLCERLGVNFDVRWTLWSSLKSLDFTFTDPAAPSGTASTKSSLPLNWRDSYALRLGAEARLLREKNLKIRAGVGYDRTPVPASTLGPLTPDSDRIIVSVGLGYSHKWFGIEAAYLAAIVLDRTSTNPDLRADFQGVGHVLSLALNFRWEKVLSRLVTAGY